METLLNPVIVWPLIRPLIVYEIGEMVLVPLATPTTEMPSMAGVMLAVIPVGCMRL